jgi:hypothetical protein
MLGVNSAQWRSIYRGVHLGKLGFAEPAEVHARRLLDLPLSRRCMQRFLRFRIGVHRLPRDAGSSGPHGVPRLLRIMPAVYSRR